MQPPTAGAGAGAGGGGGGGGGRTHTFALYTVHLHLIGSCERAASKNFKKKRKKKIDTYWNNWGFLRTPALIHTVHTTHTYGAKRAGSIS